ncbi:MAG: hypothetical protein ABIO70_24525 [Pseudomonadota bacterium]
MGGSGQSALQIMLGEEMEGLERVFFEQLAEKGEADPELELAYAMHGAGTDEERAKKILKQVNDMSPEQRAAFARRFEALSKDVLGVDQTLSEWVEGDFSGSEGFEMRMLLMGKPTTPAEYLERARMRYDFERSGVINSIGNVFMDGLEMLGAHSNSSLLNQHMADIENMFTPDGQLKDPHAFEDLKELAGWQEQDQKNYREVRDKATDYVVTAIQAIGAVVCMIIPGGQAFSAAWIAYLVKFLASMAVTAVSMIAKYALSGNGYGWEQAGIDLAQGVLEAATAGLGGMREFQKAAAGAMAAAKGLAVEGAKKSFKVVAKEALEQTVTEGAQSLLSAVITSEQVWEGGGEGELFKYLAKETLLGAAKGGAMSFLGEGMKKTPWGKKLEKVEQAMGGDGPKPSFLTHYGLKYANEVVTTGVGTALDHHKWEAWAKGEGFDANLLKAIFIDPAWKGVLQTGISRSSFKRRLEASMEMEKAQTDLQRYTKMLQSGDSDLEPQVLKNLIQKTRETIAEKDTQLRTIDQKSAQEVEEAIQQKEQQVAKGKGQLRAKEIDPDEIGSKSEHVALRREVEEGLEAVTDETKTLKRKVADGDVSQGDETVTLQQKTTKLAEGETLPGDQDPTRVLGAKPHQDVEAEGDARWAAFGNHKQLADDTAGILGARALTDDGEFSPELKAKLEKLGYTVRKNNVIARGDTDGQVPLHIEDGRIVSGLKPQGKSSTPTHLADELLPGGSSGAVWNNAKGLKGQQITLDDGRVVTVARVVPTVIKEGVDSEGNVLAGRRIALHTADGEVVVRPVSDFEQTLDPKKMVPAKEHAEVETKPVIQALAHGDASALTGGDTAAATQLFESAAVRKAVNQHFADAPEAPAERHRQVKNLIDSFGGDFEAAHAAFHGNDAPAVQKALNQHRGRAVGGLIAEVQDAFPGLKVTARRLDPNSPTITFEFEGAATPHARAFLERAAEQLYGGSLKRALGVTLSEAPVKLRDDADTTATGGRQVKGEFSDPISYEEGGAARFFSDGKGGRWGYKTAFGFTGDIADDGAFVVRQKVVLVSDDPDDAAVKRVKDDVEQANATYYNDPKHRIDVDGVERPMRQELEVEIVTRKQLADREAAAKKAADAAASRGEAYDPGIAPTVINVNKGQGRADSSNLYTEGPDAPATDQYRQMVIAHELAHAVWGLADRYQDGPRRVQNPAYDPAKDHPSKKFIDIRSESRKAHDALHVSHEGGLMEDFNVAYVQGSHKLDAAKSWEDLATANEHGIVTLYAKSNKTMPVKPDGKPDLTLALKRLNPQLVDDHGHFPTRLPAGGEVVLPKLTAPEGWGVSRGNLKQLEWHIAQAKHGQVKFELGDGSAADHIVRKEKAGDYRGPDQRYSKAAIARARSLGYDTDALDEGAMVAGGKRRKLTDDEKAVIKRPVPVADPEEVTAELPAVHAHAPAMDAAPPAHGPTPHGAATPSDDLDRTQPMRAVVAQHEAEAKTRTAKLTDAEQQTQHVVRGRLRDFMDEIKADGKGGLTATPSNNHYASDYGFKGEVADDGTYVVRKAIQLIDQGGANMERVRRELQESVQEVFNDPGHQITVDGIQRQMKVVLEFVDDVTKHPDLVPNQVRVHKGVGAVDAGNFYDDGPQVPTDSAGRKLVLAHELGHIIFGLSDTYQDRGREVSPGVWKASKHRWKQDGLYNIADRGLMDGPQRHFTAGRAKAEVGDTWETLANKYRVGLADKYRQLGAKPPIVADQYSFFQRLVAKLPLVGRKLHEQGKRHDWVAALQRENPQLWDPTTGKFRQPRPGDDLQVPVHTANEEVGLTTENLQQIQWAIAKGKAGRADYVLGDGQVPDQLASKAKEGAVGHEPLYKNKEFKQLMKDLGLAVPTPEPPKKLSERQKRKLVDQELKELKRLLRDDPASFDAHIAKLDPVAKAEPDLAKVQKAARDAHADPTRVLPAVTGEEAPRRATARPVVQEEGTGLRRQDKVQIIDLRKLGLWPTDEGHETTARPAPRPTVRQDVADTSDTPTLIMPAVRPEEAAPRPTRLADLLPGDHETLAGGDAGATRALFDDPNRRQALSRGLAATEGQPEVRARIAGELLQGFGGDFKAAHATFATQGHDDVALALDQHRSRALRGLVEDLQRQFPDLHVQPRRLTEGDPTVTLELTGGATREARAYLEASAQIELGGDLRRTLGVELSQAPVRVKPTVPGAEAAASGPDTVQGVFRDRLAHMVADGMGGARREFIPDGRGGAQAYVGQYGFRGSVADDGTYVVRKAVQLVDKDGANLEQVKQRMMQAVEEWYNQPGHRITVDGVERQLKVVLEWAEDASEDPTAAKVAVGRGTGHHDAGNFFDEGSDQHSDAKAHRQVLAHELGHLIFGLADNYQDSGGVDVGMPGVAGAVHASSGYRTYDNDPHNIGDRGLMDNFTGRFTQGEHQAAAGDSWASLALRHGPGLLDRYTAAGRPAPVKNGQYDLERMLKDANPHLFDPRHGFADLKPGDVVRVPRQTASDEAGLNERHLKQVEWLIAQSRARHGGAVDFELGDGGEVDRLAREGKENEGGRGLLHQDPEFKRMVQDLGLEETGPMAAPGAKPNKSIDEELAELKRRLAEHPETFPELEAPLEPTRVLPVVTGPRPELETTAPLPGLVRKAAPEEVTAPLPELRPKAPDAGAPTHGKTHEQLSEEVQESTKGRSRTQSTGDLDELYQQAAEADVHLRDATQRIAGLTGGEAMFPPGLKGRARAQEKAETEYGGDYTQITDLSRASIQYDSMDALYKGLQAISSEFEIARLKDRFQTPAPGGYRDMLLNVRMPNGHVVELQLHLKEILEVKGGRGHAIYEEIRTIQAHASRDGRDFTAEERQRMADLTTESEGLYGAAYQRALGHPPAGEQVPAAPEAPASPDRKALQPPKAAIVDLDQADVDDLVQAGFTRKEARRIQALREQNGGVFDFATFAALNADHEVRVLAKAAKLSGREREAVKAVMGPHENEAEAAQRIGLDPRPFGRHLEVERVAEVHNHYKGILPAEEFPGLLFPDLAGQPHEAAAATVDLLRRLYREDPDGELHLPHKKPATDRILAILESDEAQRDPGEALRRVMSASAEMPFDFTYDPRGLLIDHMKGQGRAEELVEATVLSLKRQGITYAELQGKLDTPGVEPEAFAAIGARHGVTIRMLPHLLTQQFSEGGGGFTEEKLHKLLFGKDWKEHGEVPDMVAGIDICGPENGRWDEAGMEHMEKAFSMLHRQAELSGRKLVLRPHVGEGYSGTEGQRRLGVEDDDRQGRIAHENLDAILGRIRKMRDEGTYQPPPAGSVEIRLGHVTQATDAQVRLMKELGVIAEVNIGSNMVTGALGRAQGESASRLEEHPLLMLLYHGVPTLLSTDAQGVMSTDMAKEYGFAADLVDRFRRGEVALTVPDPEDPTQRVRVRFSDLPPELQERFDARRLEKAAQDYAAEATRPRRPGLPSPAPRVHGRHPGAQAPSDAAEASEATAAPTLGHALPGAAPSQRRRLAERARTSTSIADRVALLNELLAQLEALQAQDATAEGDARREILEYRDATLEGLQRDLRAEHPGARIQRTSLGNDRLELRIEGGDEARAAEDLDKLGERELGADWKAMFGLRLVKPGPHAGRR